MDSLSYTFSRFSTRSMKTSPLGAKAEYNKYKTENNATKMVVNGKGKNG
jgi:hypothetical protein